MKSGVDEFEDLPSQGKPFCSSVNSFSSEIQRATTADVGKNKLVRQNIMNWLLHGMRQSRFYNKIEHSRQHFQQYNMAKEDDLTIAKIMRLYLMHL